jgi:cytochrome P450
VINETLRLYPPGWLLYRRTIQADSLGGYEVPAQTDVLLPLYLTHRHPKFWENPEAFRPERFAPGTELQRPRYAYVPFAAGPRHCIGETLALYEMLTHVFKAARHFQFTYVADKPIELEAGINLRSRYPLHMRVKRRP